MCKTISKWWSVQKSNFTSWKVHEKMGDKIGIPIMVLVGIPLSVWLRQPWIIVTMFAYFLGNLNGFEIHQNHLEQGKQAIIDWLQKRVVDSLMDEFVASYKSGVVVALFIFGYLKFFG